MSPIPTEFRSVTVVTKANVYFDGKVVSHSLFFPDELEENARADLPGPVPLRD